MERQRSLLRELSPLPLPSMATPGNLGPSYAYQGESLACHKPVTPSLGVAAEAGGGQCRGETGLERQRRAG